MIKDLKLIRMKRLIYLIISEELFAFYILVRKLKMLIDKKTFKNNYQEFYDDTIFITPIFMFIFLMQILMDLPAIIFPEFMLQTFGPNLWHRGNGYRVFSYLLVGTIFLIYSFTYTKIKKRLENIFVQKLVVGNYKIKVIFILIINLLCFYFIALGGI